MFKKAIIAAAAAAMVGAIGTSFAQDVEKTTVIRPRGDDSKVVVKKRTVEGQRYGTRIVHKKNVVHDRMTNTRVVHRSTVIRKPDGSKTVVVHPAQVKRDL